jgi:hypothetical protein
MRLAFVARRPSVASMYLWTENRQTMNSKLRGKPSRTDTQGALTNGAARSGYVPDADREAVWPAVAGDLAEPTSSPVASRPQAPSLSFAPQPAAEEETARPAVRAEAAPAAEVDMARDDMSVPPIDIDSGFFDEGRSHGVAVDPLFEVDAGDPRMAIKRTAAAARRRAHLAKYVTGTMGVASALLIAALVKGAVAGDREAKPSYVPSQQTVAAASMAVNVDPTPASPPSPALPAAPSSPADNAPSAPPSDPAQAAAAQPVPPPVDEAARAPVAPPQAPADVAAPPTSASAPAQAASAPRQPAAATAQPAAAHVAAMGATASQEKERSRGALERGRVGDSIASGERAVAIDPADGEAWLILGAAYQQRGDAKNATRCFKACVDQAKRGPKTECAAMLR